MIRALEIIVDGTVIGKIDQAQTSLFDIPNDSREIWGKMDWGRTKRLDISNYKIDQTVVFRGRFTLNIFKNIGIAGLPFELSLRSEPNKTTKAEQDVAPQSTTRSVV